jgi:hypothetical protein
MMLPLLPRNLFLVSGVWLGAAATGTIYLQREKVALNWPSGWVLGFRVHRGGGRCWAGSFSHKRSGCTMSSHRRVRVVGITVILLLAGGFTLWLGQRTRPGPAAIVPTFTLDELCRDSLAEGWRIKHPPDLPGPYQRRLPGSLYSHPGPDGVSTVRLREPSGAVVWEERTRPGVEFLTLILETADGQRTEGLLERGE